MTHDETPKRGFDETVQRYYTETGNGGRIYDTTPPLDKPTLKYICSDLRELYVYAEFSYPNEDEGCVESLEVFDRATGLEVDFDSLPGKDCSAIEDKLLDLAGEGAHDGYYDGVRARAEWMSEDR